MMIQIAGKRLLSKKNYEKAMLKALINTAVDGIMMIDDQGTELGRRLRKILNSSPDGQARRGAWPLFPAGAASSMHN
jgi:hypothetical protein